MSEETAKEWARRMRGRARDKGIFPRQVGDEIVYEVEDRPDLGDYRKPAPERAR